MIITGEIEKNFKFAILQMARKAISQRTQKKRRLFPQSPFFSKYAFVIRDWTKRRSISGGIYKKIGCNEI